MVGWLGTLGFALLCFGKVWPSFGQLGGVMLLSSLAYISVTDGGNLHAKMAIDPSWSSTVAFWGGVVGATVSLIPMLHVLWTPSLLVLATVIGYLLGYKQGHSKGWRDQCNHERSLRGEPPLEPEIGSAEWREDLNRRHGWK